MPFADQIAAGINLIRQALQSPNFVTGVLGWTIRKDGSAEFAEATVRGTIDVVGLNGGEITIVPDGGNSGTIPTIKLFSPDGTNFAFFNVISPTNSQAELGINSGHFTPGDGIARFWRIFAADNNIIQSVVKLANQSIFGGYFQMSNVGIDQGYRDVDSVVFTLFRIQSGLVQLFQDTGGAVDFTNAGARIADSRLYREYELDANANLALSGTGYQDIPGMSVTFDTHYNNAQCSVTATFDTQVTVALGAGELATYQLLVDGVAQAGTPYTDASVKRIMVPGAWYFPIAAAGTHTVKLQGKKASGTGTASCLNSVTQGVVTVMDNESG